ncbi:MAG: substrate-binding periplasmic protein [Pseudomonas sp.]
MRGVWLALLLCAQGVFAAQVEPALPGEIRLASEVWSGHTEADGRGLAWDILRAVFEPAGIKLQIRSVPYTRSIGLVQRGEADAWVGSYLNEVREGVFYSHWHYDADQISALSRADGPEVSLATLGDFRRAWVRGYAYQKYLPNLTDFQEIYRRDGILSMLALGHMDFYIDARTEVDDVLGEAADKSTYRVTDITLLPLYLGFADTPDGHALAQLFDRRMATLVKAGSLRPLYARWQQPYPFK